MSNADDLNRAVEQAVTIRRVAEAGHKEFPSDWKERTDLLHVLGAGVQIIDDVSAASSTPHRLYHHLGGDLATAARIAELDPRQRIRELGRFDMEMARPKALPTPTPPARPKHWPEGSDEKQVTEEFYAMMKRKAQRR
jgi:hypothetical protein